MMLPKERERERKKRKEVFGQSDMANDPFRGAASRLIAIPSEPRQGSASLVLLALIIIPGCGSSSPVAPDGARPMISGQIYQTLTRDADEPPLVDVLITVRNATGQETTALSNRGGFLSASMRRDQAWCFGDRGEKREGTRRANHCSTSPRVRC